MLLKYYYFKAQELRNKIKYRIIVHRSESTDLIFDKPKNIFDFIIRLSLQQYCMIICKISLGIESAIGL